MTVQEQNVAFPRLLGAPAYARPPRTVELAARPFDPDALPLAVEQTPDERVIAGIDVSGRMSFAGARRSPIAVMPWPTSAAAHGGYVPPIAVDAAPAGDALRADARVTGDGSISPLRSTLRGLGGRLRVRR